MRAIDEQFTTGMDDSWTITETGDAEVLRRPGRLSLTLHPTDGTTYHNSQISDYEPATRKFQYQPPLRMTITAYFSASQADLKGTAGFGFWNHPFAPGEKGMRRPQALWYFFSSPESRMPLALDGADNGWKAATFNAKTKRFLALLPTALPGFLLMRIPVLHRLLWPIAQRAIGVNEAVLPADLLTSAHTYTLDWLPDCAIFSVDDDVVLKVDNPPTSALGFVAWMDNQTAIVTPQGTFKFGLTGIERGQSLVLEHVTITPLR